ELELKNVRTYVQSGNVIFKVPKISRKELSQKIREKILTDFEVSVSAIILSSEELNDTIKNNPFLLEKGIDASKLHVTFLSDIPKKDTIKELEEKSTAPDEFRYFEKRIYLYCPNGYGRSKISNNAIEKMFSVTATTRNWKTLNEIYRITGIL
ncbi:MAG: DUF1697 domain-containing protein, partial [Nitrospiria bacterium]